MWDLEYDLLKRWSLLHLWTCTDGKWCFLKFILKSSLYFVTLLFLKKKIFLLVSGYCLKCKEKICSSNFYHVNLTTLSSVLFRLAGHDLSSFESFQWVFLSTFTLCLSKLGFGPLEKKLYWSWSRNAGCSCSSLCLI